MDERQWQFACGRRIGLLQAIDILEAEKAEGAGYMDTIIQPFLDQLISRLNKEYSLIVTE